MNKKGSHVEIVISFVIFITFLVFLYSVMEPAVTKPKTKDYLMQELKPQIIDYISANVAQYQIELVEGTGISQTNTECIPCGGSTDTCENICAAQGFGYTCLGGCTIDDGCSVSSCDTYTNCETTNCGGTILSCRCQRSYSNPITMKKCFDILEFNLMNITPKYEEHNIYGAVYPKIINEVTRKTLLIEYKGNEKPYTVYMSEEFNPTDENICGADYSELNRCSATLSQGYCYRWTEAGTEKYIFETKIERMKEIYNNYTNNQDNSPLNNKNEFNIPKGTRFWFNFTDEDRVGLVTPTLPIIDESVSIYSEEIPIKYIDESGDPDEEKMGFLTIQIW